MLNKLNNWKSVITLVIIAIASFALYASFTMPVRFEVVRYEGTFGSATWDVTKQAKNIYGMNVGEEHTYTELTPYWEAQWHRYCESQGWCD